MKKTIYRTIIQLTVLSDEPVPDGMCLEEIGANCDDGDFCGKSEYKEFNKPITGKDAANAVIDTGSDTEFFQMDKDGNDLETEEES
jgi:hypothetical protein